MTIFKYVAPFDKKVVIDLPVGARLLPYMEIAPYKGSMGLYVWAQVNPDEEEMEAHSFYVRGTGQPTYDDEVYLQTIRRGVFVWHIFKGGPE